MQSDFIAPTRAKGNLLVLAYIAFVGLGLPVSLTGVAWPILSAHISLAWMRQKIPFVAPVIGATRIPHLENAVEALSVKLSLEEMAYQEEPYVPHPIVGLIPYGGQLLSTRK